MQIMVFPEAERVIYNRNPLRRIICQLRFPPILRIETEVPSSFQDKIRGQYSGYELRSSAPPLPGELPPQVVQAILARLPAQKQHRFVTDDRTREVSLTRDFLALESTQYTRWREFNAALEGPLDALLSAYEPAQFDRIGLRYVNVIVRSALGLTGAKWSELLNPELVGILASAIVGDNVRTVTGNADVLLPEVPAVVRIQHGLTEEQSEDGYALDIDLFTETPTEVTNAKQTLSTLNTEARRLFAWAILPRLADAMGPVPIGDVGR
jgi:uncharacterized protein (TIGR04255 family)